MATTKGSASGKSGGSGPGDSERSQPAVSSSLAADKTIDSILTRQSDCLQELKRICTRVESESNKLAAERMNKLLQMQLTTYKARVDAYVRSGVGAPGATVPPAAEQNLWQEFENAQKQEQQATEDADGQAIAAMKELNESANQDWEKSLRLFLESIKDDLEKIGEGAVNPDLLVTIGQSLIWISSCLRRPGSDASSGPSSVSAKNVMPC